METSALYLYLLSPCDVLSSFPIYLTSWHGILDDRCFVQARKGDARRRMTCSEVSDFYWHDVMNNWPWLLRVIDLHLLFPSLTKTVISAVTASFVRGLETDSSYMSSKIWTVLLADTRWGFFPLIILKNQKPFECVHIRVATVSFV